MLTNKKIVLKGQLNVPFDKSILHRAFITAAIADGTSFIRVPICGFDCLSTIHCLRNLGVSITMCKEGYQVDGVGIHGLKSYEGNLNCENSGTTARLLMGLLSGQQFCSHLTGDHSLSQRPMGRVSQPLGLMGASICYQQHEGVLPLTIHPRILKGITYDMTVPSAQVKSAIIYAALYADEMSCIRELTPTRNHTELFLSHCGVQIQEENHIISIYPTDHIHCFDLEIPGDFSSAAYFIAAALILPDSEICIRKVGINPTRVGFLSVIKEMGGHIQIENQSLQNGEPIGDIYVKYSLLKGITIDKNKIPSLIDELPLIAILACCAQGKTLVQGAQELRIKECDRIHAIVENLTNMNADIIEYSDGFAILGGQPLTCTTVKTYNDHRIAMSFTIASLFAKGTLSLDNTSCVAVSYPEFFQDLSNLTGQSIIKNGSEIITI